MAIRALLLEDDLLMAKLLQHSLPHEGIRVTHCLTLKHASEYLEQHNYELALVDRMLGDEDGLDFVRHARARYPALGIIVLSAKGMPVDRIVGLESGADDYLPKPFDLRELVVRMRRLATRARSMMPLYHGTILKFLGFSLDPLARSVTHTHAGPVPLTGREFDLLHRLIRSGHRTVSRKVLSHSLHSRTACTTERTVDTLIANIRRKLRDAVDCDPVKTIRNEGYAFAAPVSHHPRSGEDANSA